MATKLSPADHRRPKSTAPLSLAPKISIFGTKAGFVIPKNKLAGSLVTRGTTSKNEIPTASKEDNIRHVQRKTKWGPDLATDPAVCRGRALAYQTRVEQITKQLKSGTLDMGKTEGSMSTEKGSNSVGSDNFKEDEQRKVELLELERREIIGEILCLNPGYKVPENYKPVLKETKIPLPAEAHPGHSIIGVLIGPESNTQKRLHEETGAVIQVYGTKKINGEKSELHDQDINEAEAAYEDLHINVSADSYDKVDAAVSLIELLLAPVSVKPTATSTTTAVSSVITSDDVNPVQNTTSQPDLLHYQSHNTPWLSTPQTDGPSIPSSGHVLSTLPNNLLQPQLLAGPFSMPPYAGQPPHTNNMPRNLFPVPVPQQPIPSNQQHPPQFRASSPIGPFGQPPGIVSPQMTPSSLVPPPVRPLQIPHASGGWPSFSPITSQSQWPPQASTTFMPVRPPISVSPLGATPPQARVALTPSSNMPTVYRSQQPAGANFACSATLVSRPPGGVQSFSTVAPQGPSSVAFPGGASTQSAYPLSMQVVSTPDQMRGPPPAFSQVGPNSGMVPPSAASSSCPPASGPASTSCSQAPMGALRPPPRRAAGDFTFRPVVSPAPGPDFAASGGQMGIQGRSHPGPPFFHPGNQSPRQGFQRPCDGSPAMNMMGQARMQAPPPHFHGAFPRNPSPLELPGGFRAVPPAAPAPSNPPGFLPPRSFQLRPSPQPNPSFAGRNRQGGNSIYHPFAPTAAQKTEAADPEYEDLMASVGVK